MHILDLYIVKSFIVFRIFSFSFLLEWSGLFNLLKCTAWFNSIVRNSFIWRRTYPHTRGALKSMFVIFHPPWIVGQGCQIFGQSAIFINTSWSLFIWLIMSAIDTKARGVRLESVIVISESTTLCFVSA